jgi:hypothetical protein
MRVSAKADYLTSNRNNDAEYFKMHFMRWGEREREKKHKFMLKTLNYI